MVVVSVRCLAYAFTPSAIAQVLCTQPPREAHELQVMMQRRGLLALWVTNRERHRRFVDAELLPAWGLRQVAAWYWLKVTNDGRLVSSLVCIVSFCLSLIFCDSFP